MDKTLCLVDYYEKKEALDFYVISGKCKKTQCYNIQREIVFPMLSVGVIGKTPFINGKQSHVSIDIVNVLKIKEAVDMFGFAILSVELDELVDNFDNYLQHSCAILKEKDGYYSVYDGYYGIRRLECRCFKFEELQMLVDNPTVLCWNTFWHSYEEEEPNKTYKIFIDYEYINKNLPSQMFVK